MCNVYTLWAPGQWAICVVIGAGELIWNAFVNLVPESVICDCLLNFDKKLDAPSPPAEEEGVFQ